MALLCCTDFGRLARAIDKWGPHEEGSEVVREAWQMPGVACPGDTPAHLFYRYRSHGCEGYTHIDDYVCVCEAFLRNGADLERPNGEGVTPFDLMPEELKLHVEFRPGGAGARKVAAGTRVGAAEANSL